LEDFGRVDVNMPMNDREKFPDGSYSELEWLLLQLELLSDQLPRANLKYQLKQPEKGNFYFFFSFSLLKLFVSFRAFH
jgi:hypothetical protein